MTVISIFEKNGHHHKQYWFQERERWLPEQKEQGYQHSDRPKQKADLGEKHAVQKPSVPFQFADE
jgi:hypothetical protein